MKIKANQTLNNVVEDKTTFFYYTFRNIIIIGLPLLAISTLVLSHLSFRSSATSSSIPSGTDNIQLNLSTSCTINAVVTSEHTVSLNGGQLDNNVGNTKLSAFCNDNNGYGIYAIGSSNDIDGNTELINTVNESYNIRTGVYDSNNIVNPSSWAMKLTAGSGTGIDPVSGDSVPTTPPSIVNGYNNYSAIPNTYTLVAKRTSGTSMTPDTSVSGSYLNTTYQIYANSAQPSGTYNGKVKYIMIHPGTNAPNTINDIDVAFAMAGKQKVYQDNNGSYYAMQDMSHDICNSVTRTGAETTTQLVDIRDNNLYYVTKLADGNCWMTQNLDLDIGGTNVAALTSENTDLSTTTSGSGIYNAAGGYTQNDGIWTWTPSDSAVTSSHVISNNSVPGWSNQSALPYSAEGGDVYYYTSNGAGGDTTFSSLQACKDANHTEADCKHYHRGNYYNWTAAVASNSSGDFTTNLTQAANSICPKNWRLPVASNSNQSIFEFGDLLYTAYNIATAKQGTNITDQISYTTDGFNDIRKAPLWFVRSGRISSTTLYDAVHYGYYWSSTVASGSSAYGLNFYNSGVWPAYSLDRGGGRSVRCIAR